MKYLIIASAFLLVGCAAPVPVKHTFPKPPEVVIESCPRLNELKEDEEKLSELLKIVTQNYNLYHECATKHSLLVRWINEQKAIHDALFNK